MMGKRIVILALLSVLAGSSVLFAGPTSFNFMLIGPGSRQSAMGEAFTAVSGDIGAAYFNPAAAGVMNHTEFSFMHIKYLTDVTMEQFSFLTRTGKFRYGLGLYLGKIANIVRMETPTDNPSYFDEHNFTGSFFWALPVNDKLSIGNSIKWAYEKIDLGNASALAFDFGAFYTLIPQVTLGAAVRNLGTKPKFVDVAYDLPREFRLGASYRTRPDSRFRGLTFSSDYIIPKWGDGTSKVNIGAEYSYQNFVALRAGYSGGYNSRGVTVGGGFSYQRYYFDYAFVPSQNNLGSTHRFTLRIRI